ncbi:50S ribosomal protein L6 [Candidatus Woesearchaeota archaeon]|nr:50S ribosomal protein L6 [Candidatus Woesearchaeota archaeon]
MKPAKKQGNKRKYKEVVIIPEGVQIGVQDKTLTVKGKKGELKREMAYPGVVFMMQDNKMVVQTEEETSKRGKRMVGTFAAHLTNMTKGVSKGHVYKLKVCSSHFPMTVAISGDTFSVKNFMGGKVPRTTKIKKGVKVEIKGNDIIVEGPNKELAGQVAADIETLTRRPNFDPRIFQDGLYITEKDGKPIA